MNFDTEARKLLEDACIRLGKDTVAHRLGKSPKALTRWKSDTIPEPRMTYHALRDIVRIDRPADLVADFTFADLFAGIGGTRLGFEAAGGQCVFTSEYDRFSQATYRENFESRNSAGHKINGDITEITGKGAYNIGQEIPDHDVLVAGFPCQPFSVAGVSKKRSLGQAEGFACEAQGTLFFDIAQILKIKRPHAFLLENVKNLKSHDGGQTYKVIMKTLQEELGYHVYPNVVDARHFVPQHRERIFLVGFREPLGFDWENVRSPSTVDPTLAVALHPQDASEQPEKDYTIGKKAEVNKKYVLSDKLWNYLQDYAAKHKAKGNGFGYGLFEPENVARTLSARYYKDGSEILIKRGRGNPRRLTPRECARIMGFPDSFEIPVSDTQAYKQFGNAMVIPVIEAIARSMKPGIVQLKHTEVSEQQIALSV